MTGASGPTAARAASKVNGAGNADSRRNARCSGSLKSR